LLKSNSYGKDACSKLATFNPGDEAMTYLRANLQQSREYNVRVSVLFVYQLISPLQTSSINSAQSLRLEAKGNFGYSLI